MKKRFTQSVKSGAALVCAVLLLAVCAGGLKAQNPWPDYDFKAANADGDTLYYRDPLPRFGHLRFAIAIE